MSTEQIVITTVVVAVAAVVIIYVLRKRDISLTTRKGDHFSAKQPQQRAGISLEDVTAPEGKITVENNTGDGVAGKGLAGAKGVSVTNNPSPKR